MTGQAGDARELTRLFDRHADEIYRFARYSLGDAAAAEDAVQEVFLGAWRSLGRFRGAASERTWLFAIARRVVAGQLRAARGGVSAPAALQGASPDVAPGAAQRLDLERGLAALPLGQRQVFILRIIEDRSVSETARLLGRPAVWVRVTQHRALARLRQALSPAADRVEGGREA